MAVMGIPLYVEREASTATPRRWVANRCTWTASFAGLAPEAGGPGQSQVMEQCPCPAAIVCNHIQMNGFSKEMQFSSGRVVTALRQLSTICWMAAMAASGAPGSATVRNEAGGLSRP